MHSKHVMIDIETLSTENDAAIIAIGAVEFNLDSILDEKIWLIDPRLATGRRDVSTLEWWEGQIKDNPDLAWRVWSGTERENIVAAELFNWMVPFGGPFPDVHWVWAGPSTFDLNILKTWYRSQNMILPWNFRQERDLTTISRLADQLGIDYSGEKFDGFEAHNPVSDCIKQARRCQIILRELNRRNDTWASYDLANKERPGL